MQVERMEAEEKGEGKKKRISEKWLEVFGVGIDDCLGWCEEGGSLG